MIFSAFVVQKVTHVQTFKFYLPVEIIIDVNLDSSN